MSTALACQIIDNPAPRAANDNALGYDEIKNRVNVSDDSQAAGAGWGGTGTDLRAIGYDVRGNVTSLGSMSFDYDTSDQPITVTGSRNGTAFNNSNYVYDGNLKRVKSVMNGKTIYNVYSQSGRLMHVEDVTPFDGGLTERTDYIGAGGMSIARVTHGQGRYYLHNDHLGSPVTMAYSTGGIALRTRYTPFGLEMDNHARRADHAGFTGHIKDSATGLNYMQARYYDPVIGRFLSIDPVTFMDTGDPRYFNRYTYTANNPINLTDPDGRIFVENPNNTPQDSADLAEALSYISRSPTAKGSHDAVDGNSRAVTITVTRTGDHKYVPEDKEIFFNPELASSDTNNGSVSSPASQLGHEIRHADRHLNELGDVGVREMGSVGRQREEHDVSTGFQNQMNRELNERGAQEGQRTGHSHNPVPSNDVTNGNHRRMIPFEDK